MEAQTPLVGADRVVVLDAPPALDANTTVVVFPADAKTDHAIGLGQTAQDLRVQIFGLVHDEIEDIARHFANGLDEFVLPRIAIAQFIHEAFEIRCCVGSLGIRHDSIPPVSGTKSMLAAHRSPRTARW